jgi:carboxyl-terminal processing protease
VRAAFALFCAGLSFAAVAADAPTTGVQELRAAETFAMVWSKLRDSSFDPELERVDWAALESRHRPAIEGARDRETLRREIGALLQAIGVSHLSLIPAEAVAAPKAPPVRDRRRAGDDVESDTSADVGDDDLGDEDKATENEGTVASVGLRVRLIDGAMHVVAVAPGSAAADAGIAPGWHLERIDAWRMDGAVASLAQQPPGQARRRAELHFQMQVADRLEDLETGDEVTLDLRDLAARPHRKILAARPRPGEPLELLPGMPPVPMHYEATRRALPDGGCALLVAFNLWAQPTFDRLAATLRDERGCDRLILDLRANPGGQLWTLTAIAGLLHDRKTQLGTMTSADGTLRMIVFPRRIDNDGRPLRQLLGPIAILIDRGSASSSEIFASALQATGRARIFGETSAGMALPAMTARLPSGDWLYYPTADITDPSGRRIEGRGVAPDTAIALEVSGLAKGGDPILDAAMGWIAEAAAPTPTTAAPRP